MSKQLAEFKSQLETFAVKHKKDINENPVFRDQFLKMCKSAGVDPLSSNKGFWVDILGVGDFYYELAVSRRALLMTFLLDSNCEHLYCYKKKEWRIFRRE